MSPDSNDYHQIALQAKWAFEQPTVPAGYDHPSDLFMMQIKPDDNADALHIWVDETHRTSQARRVFWRKLFDQERLKDPTMASRYGRELTPSLKLIDYLPPYDELQKRISALLGALPSEPLLDDRRGSPSDIKLVLRLPLSQMSLVWRPSLEGWEAFIQQCGDLHNWVLTTPRIPREPSF